MDEYIINYNGYNYKINICENTDGTFILVILDPASYFGAVVNYIPCDVIGYNNYDILINNEMDETTIDNLIKLFNKIEEL